MNSFTSNTYQHVCPRNCYSTCTFLSQVENGRLVQLIGDPDHPYTNGKLCAKGYAYLERNEHPERLMYPYYRKNKQDKFSPITWEKAYDLLVNQLSDIYDKHKNFLPLGLYKYSGNLGVLQSVTEEFFHNLGATTRIAGSPCSSAGIEALHYQTGALKMSDPAEMIKSDLIILWGANPANTNIHLIPFITQAKARGARVVVIDPLFTKTAELAHLYIQLRPSTDGALANLLVQALFETEAYDKKFLAEHTSGFMDFLTEIKNWDQADYLISCEVSPEAVEVLVAWLQEAKAVSHLIGFGLQRHSNGGQNIRAIEALAAMHGDIGKKGAGVFYAHLDSTIFNNQQLVRDDNRMLDMNKWIAQPDDAQDLEMMWIACRNPLTQDPNPKAIQSHLEKIPFVVTVDQFMTPTAECSNLVLPTTTLFEQMDVMTSYWHREIALNEKAISPYYGSLSEWNIMTEISVRLNEKKPGISSLPILTSEEEYLDYQFNAQVHKLYGVKSVADLRNKNLASHRPTRVAWEEKQFFTPSGRYQFLSEEAKENGYPLTPVFVAGKLPGKQFPFWLLTPHHPYALNSQFHFLDLTEEHEACVEIHSKTARELAIFNGEVIRVFNEQDSITIKAVYSTQVPKDILVIYEGWYPNANMVLNRLIPVLETDMGKSSVGANGVAFYDTFVNIAKL